MTKIIFASFLWLVLISLVIADLIDMTYMEIITTIKDIILASCAIVGAFVALKGLGTWQRQLTGQAEYDLSRRLLVGLFKYRDAIDNVRNPAIFSYEMPDPPEEQAQNMSQDQISFYGRERAYSSRVDKLNENKVGIYADLLEAEAVWGLELKELFEKVFLLESELIVAIWHYLDSVNPDISHHRKEAINKKMSSHRNVLYDLSEKNKADDFKKELLDAIQEIEIYLKPKLIH